MVICFSHLFLLVYLYYGKSVPQKLGLFSHAVYQNNTDLAGYI